MVLKPASRGCPHPHPRKPGKYRAPGSRRAQFIDGTSARECIPTMALLPWGWGFLACGRTVGPDTTGFSGRRCGGPIRLFPGLCRIAVVPADRLLHMPEGLEPSWCCRYAAGLTGTYRPTPLSPQIWRCLFNSCRRGWRRLLLVQMAKQCWSTRVWQPSLPRTKLLWRVKPWAERVIL